MKSLIILAVAELALGQSAEAQRRGGGHRGGHRGCTDVWGNRVPCNTHGCTDIFGTRVPCTTEVVTVTCAPGVVASNLEKADAALSQLAAADLKSNATFSAKVAEVTAIQSAQDKSAAYMNLAGVNANNAEDVLNFLYAREVSASSVLAVQKNLDLNADQATIVINKLTSALKPLN